MKRITFASMLLLMGLAMSASALNGRVIEVTTASDASPFTPVFLPYDGPAPEGQLVVVHQATGDIAPGAVYDGNLTFVPPSLPSGEAQRFEVQVRDEETAPRVRLEHDAAEGTIAVYVRDVHFTTYNFGEDLRIPYLWPVHAEGGITITRNFPMGKDDPAVEDHIHHMSLWTAFGDVNGHDTWHRTPIRTKSIEALSGDAVGVIRAHNVWEARNGDPLVDEIREYRFYDGPAGVRFIDQSITFNAAHGDVTFGDDKEGLVAFRIRTEIQGNQAGVLTSFEGKQGEREVYGTPGPWMDYSGPVAGVGNRGIALFSSPDNFRQPAWHVRNYGLFASNPFAMNDVARLGEDGSVELAEGDSLRFSFRIYVHSGDVEEAAVAQRYADYATPPEVAWVE